MMLRRTIRLTLRQHRFGFAMLLVAALAFAAAGVFLAWLAFGPAAECRRAALQPNLTETEIYAIGERCRWLEGPVFVGTQFVMYASSFLPLIAALLLAAPLIAVELELGTATLAWGLARTRRSWLLPRMGIVVLLTVGVGIAAGLALDSINAQTGPGGSPWASFASYPLNGAIIAARTLLVASAGLFAGALMGRQMPALIVAASVAFAIAVLITGEDAEINRANQIVLGVEPSAGSMGPGPYDANALYFEDRPQDIATGEILTWDQFPNGFDPNDPAFNTKYQMVRLGLPASQAPFVTWRHVGFYALPSLLMLGLTFVVVERRRPYLS